MMLSSSHGRQIPYRVVIVLFIWVLIAALSWADMLDQTDAMSWPRAELQQALESDIDEITEQFSTTLSMSDPFREYDDFVLHARINAGMGDAGPIVSSSIPLYSRFSNYRI